MLISYLLPSLSSLSLFFYQKHSRYNNYVAKHFPVNKFFRQPSNNFFLSEDILGKNVVMSRMISLLKKIIGEYNLSM